MSENTIEWIKSTPHSWEIKPLGSFATIKARLGWKGLKAEEYVEQGYTFLATPNIKGDEIDFDNVNFITKERYDESPEIMLRQGDVLLVKDGATLGIVAHVNKLPVPTTVNGSIAVIRPKADCHDRYLFYWLRSKGVQQLIDKIKGGMGVPHLFQRDLKRFPVLLSTLPEQRQIAAHLDEKTGKIDRLMRLRRRQMELLREQRAALIQQAVTRGLNPGAPLKDSHLPWLGQIPEHWEVKRLKFLGFFKGGAGFPHEDQGKEDGEIPFIKVKALGEADREGIVRKSDDYVSKETAARLSAFVFPAHSVVFAKVGAALLLNRFRALGQPTCIDNNMMGFISDYRKIQWPFLLHSLSLLNFAKLVNPGPVPSLNESQISNQQIPVPPLAEQQQILAHIERETAKLDAIHQRYKRQLALLAEYRASLIHESVTGQREVPEVTLVSKTEPSANIPFRRSVLATEIIHRLHAEATFGRVKLEKILYLSEAFVGIDLEGNYKRAAAGPFDNKALRSIESQIQKQKWYHPVKNDKGTRYLPLEKAGAHGAYFERYWPEHREKFDALIDLFRSKKTDICEIVATLFKAWKDRVEADQPIDDELIVDEVLHHWHPNKQNIPRERWLKGLAWMREQQIIPRPNS